MQKRNKLIKIVGGFGPVQPQEESWSLIGNGPSNRSSNKTEYFEGGEENSSELGYFELKQRKG